MWSKQSFPSDATNFCQYDRTFHTNARWKSPHIGEPTHLAGPAHLTWTAPNGKVEQK